MSVYTKDRGQGTLWLLSQLDSLPTSPIVTKTALTNSESTTWALECVTLIKDWGLDALEFAYSLGRIPLVIPQSLFSSLGHGDYNG